ncbi:hypothetical protein EON81_17695 [bacterium]|nr:MAG: hypothetical protein EON81_17695 [bacterium]
MAPRAVANWVECIGIRCGELILQAGLSTDYVPLVGVAGRGGLKRHEADPEAVWRLFDPEEPGVEEPTRGLVMERMPSGIRVRLNGNILGTVDAARLGKAWGVVRGTQAASGGHE